MIWRFHLIRRPAGLHSRGIGAILYQRNKLDFVRFAEAIPWMRGGLSAFIAGLGEVEFMSLRKPYRSVDEQLRILRSRGMAVDAGAGHVLRREGYYPIVNGYKDLFLD